MVPMTRFVAVFFAFLFSGCLSFAQNPAPVPREGRVVTPLADDRQPPDADRGGAAARDRAQLRAATRNARGADWLRRGHAELEGLSQCAASERG